MIFWICLIVFIVAIVVGIIAYDNDMYDLDILAGICLGLAVVLLITLIIMTFIICANRIDEKGQLEAEQVQREMLVYQYENDFYENDNDIGKYELLKSITEWNVNIASNKVSQHNIWISIFVPHIYDELELIDISIGEK